MDRNYFHRLKSCVLNTCWSSIFFTVYRGVRQVCPISPYLFILFAKILAISVRRLEDITVFKYKRVETKICQFADDTQSLLDGSEQSIQNTIILLNNYSIISGLNVNYNKSELAPLG